MVDVFFSLKESFISVNCAKIPTGISPEYNIVKLG